jgi:hypothetical protein
MTTTFPTAGEDGMAAPTARQRGRRDTSTAAARARGAHARALAGSWLARHPAWPIVAMLAGYPLWWALGIADFMFPLLAIPMAARMLAWRAHGRAIRLPPGFGLWLLFLLWVLAGAVTLSLTAPGTVDSAVSHRIISFVNRGTQYAGVTVLLLYAGNLTRQELSRQRLAWLLGLLAIYATAGGVLGMLDPGLQFSSPTLALMPSSLQSNVQIQAMMHPGLSQIQTVLGAPEGRPKAPFDYTNTWGNCLALLLPWLLAAWWSHGTRRQRWIAAGVAVIAVAPIIYSLNRGVWLALGVAGAYVAVRFATRGRVALLGAICGGLVLITLAIVATPLQQVIALRFQHQKSNSLRTSLSVVALEDGLASPIIGYGDTRQQIGGPQSITVGPTANCRNCGQAAVGSNGQLWLLLVCNGIVGASLYLLFFVRALWRYRRDMTPYGLAGSLAVLMSFVFMISYDAVGAPLAITMLSVALLWRNDRERALDHAVPGGQRALADMHDAGPDQWPAHTRG